MDNSEFFRKNLKGKTLIVGIGNTMMGDDGAGPELIKKCRENGVPYDTLDVGETPENYAVKISKGDYDTILLVDAVHMNKKPGETKILDAAYVLDTTSSTHNFSMKTYIDYLVMNTRAKVILVGIQPKDTSFGGGLSPEISDAIENIVKEGLLCTS